MIFHNSYVKKTDDISMEIKRTKQNGNIFEHLSGLYPEDQKMSKYGATTLIRKEMYKKVRNFQPGVNNLSVLGSKRENCL